MTRTYMLTGKNKKKQKEIMSLSMQSSRYRKV